MPYTYNLKVALNNCLMLDQIMLIIINDYSLRLMYLITNILVLVIPYCFVGMTVVLGGFTGAILAGVLVKRFKLTALSMIKIQMFASIAAAALMSAALLHCDSVSFAGVNVNYENSTVR